MTPFYRTQLEELNDRVDYIKKAKEEGTFYDACVNFHLEDEIQENLFNWEINQPEFIELVFKILKTGADVEPVTRELKDAIKTRIIHHSHINIMCYGPTNGGKSEMAQAIAKYYQKAYEKLMGSQPEFKLLFGDPQLRRALPTLQIGELIIRDESGQVSQKGSRNLEKRIQNVLNIAFRKHQNPCIFVNPDLIENPMIDYYIYVQGKNYETREVRGILYAQYKSRINPRETVIVPYGRIFFKLHNDEEFRKSYEEAKIQNIEGLLANEGLIADKPNVKKIERDARILVGECRKWGGDTKKSMELYLYKYNDQFDLGTEGDKLIGGDDHYNELLFEQTRFYLDHPEQMRIDAGETTKKDVQKEEELVLQLRDYVFPYTEEEILEIAKKDNHFRKPERNLEIWELITRRKNPLLQKDIKMLYPEINVDGTVTNIKNRVQNLLNQIKGRLHEKEYAKHLRAIYEKNPNNKVILDGSKGQPDIYVLLEATNEMHVFSLKNLELGESIRSYPISELEPELRFARDHRFEYKKVRVFVALVNNHTNTFSLYEIYDFARIEPLKLF